MSGSAKKKRDRQRRKAADHMASDAPGGSVTRADARTVSRPHVSSTQGSRSETFHVRHSVFIGPLPAPETMAEYKAIIPDGPERIVGMWERQAAHRQKLENRDSWGELLLSVLGLISATGIVGLLGYFGYELLRDGKDVAGFTSLIGALAGLGTIFYVARRAKRE